MKKGTFLIFSLWVFVLLSLFCFGLGFRTLIEVRKTKFFTNRMRSSYLAFSGVTLARDILRRDKESEVNLDHRGEEWAQISRELKETYSYPPREGSVIVVIEDECSRLNINELIGSREDLLVDFFGAQGIVNAQNVVHNIADYIDADYELRAIGSFDSETEVKNGKLKVLQELLYIQDFTLSDYEKIEDVITVYGHGKVNINTVQEEMLSVLLDILEINQELKDEVMGKLFFSGEVSPGYYESNDALPNELRDLFTIASDTYRVTSTAQVEGVQKKITCVIDRDRDTILYWHEE